MTSHHPHSKRIVVATAGSLGDLHPCLAVALALRQRGHDVVFATAPFYRERIERHGLAYVPVGPDFSPDDPEMIRKVMDLRRGPEFLLRKLFLPYLPRVYGELDEACKGADLLLAGEVVFAAPLLGAKRNLPWVSVILSPFSFLSAHDPSIIPGVPWLGSVRHAPWLHRLAGRAVQGRLQTWAAPIHDLRRELGLPKTPNTILKDKFAASLVLCLFSRHFGAPQPDWPAHLAQPGFVYYPQPPIANSRLAEFLAGGPPPVVFTLGSAAVHAPGDFFAQSAAVARALGCRAVLVGGRADLSRLETPEIVAVPYANYSDLFPSAAAVVHQGGIGTTAEALRAGVPALITPHGFDQPDNAARVQRLGLGLKMAKHQYTAAKALPYLRRLLENPGFREQTQAFSRQMQTESGLAGAVEAIEGIATMGAAG